MQSLSQYDIKREVEALRDIRRRSTAPGALAMDPDLPSQGPPSPTAQYGQDTSSGAEHTSEQTSPASDDPFHLFWVPASLHPEIAPAEFRAFLKEHARNPPNDDDPTALQRSASTSSTVPSGLGRKKSMLSRPYEPSENDSADDRVVPLRRNKSSIYSTNKNQGPQLTISDLQKLEELAEEASGSDDPARLRNILRRSLSLNVSPLSLGDESDEADQPIVVAPPGQFLRRAARTKIRKPGLPGDGGGHRFGASRRGPSARSATSPGLQRTSSDVSSSDHGDSVESGPQRPRTFSDEGPQDRPESFSEEAMIYDAYARDEDDDLLPPAGGPAPPPVLVTSPMSIDFDIPDFDRVEPSPPPPPAQQPPLTAEPALLEALGPVVHQPQPTRLAVPAADPYQQQQTPQTLPVPSRTPSPSDFEASPNPSPSGTPASSPPASSFLSTSPSPRKEKDKNRGLFGKWGGDKEKPGKGGKKEKERERLEKEREKEAAREKEKESAGFFGSLFGGGKKKQDAQAAEGAGGSGSAMSQHGREAAQALLGQSQSRANKSPGPPSPMMMGGMMAGAGGINNYSRYPIHVERAIYRLSHIKLANPRRPLYEQVLISNLMFWYLGVINKAQAGAAEAAAAATATAAAAANGQQQPAGQDVEKEKAERERVEKEAAAAAAAAQERAEKERVERERVERERAEREQWEREQEMKKREAAPRRGALTKAPPPGGAQQRRAEMPVKGPQYEMQHRVMEKEYGGYNANGTARPTSGPSGGGPYARPQQSPTSPKFSTPPSSAPASQEHFYYSPGETMQQQPRLPPGAMPPADQSTWLVGQQQHKHSNSSPTPITNPGAPHRRSRSPPPPSMNHSQQPMPVYNPDGAPGGARLGGRSLSATAVPSPSPPPAANGKIRKGVSAYAGAPPTSNGRKPRTSGGGAESDGAVGEEEDVPLAVWQRRQQR